MRKGGALDWASSMSPWLRLPRSDRNMARKSSPGASSMGLFPFLSGFVAAKACCAEPGPEGAAGAQPCNVKNAGRLIVFPWLRGPIRGRSRSHIVCSKQAPSRSACPSLPRVLFDELETGLAPSSFIVQSDGMFFGKGRTFRTSLTENTNFLPCK